jgi:hypothetical protein
VVAIEVTRAGTIELLSRTRRQSFPLPQLVRVRGSTSTAGRSIQGLIGRTRHRIVLEFRDPQGKAVERAIPVWGRWDGSLTALVARLQELTPEIDASSFWGWRPAGPARGTTGSFDPPAR